MLRVAGRSPSWCNVQPWAVTVLSGQARRDAGDRLLAAFDERGSKDPDVPFPTGYTGVHGERRRESGLALCEALGVGRDDRTARAAEMKRNSTSPVLRIRFCFPCTRNSALTGFSIAVCSWSHSCVPSKPPGWVRSLKVPSRCFRARCARCCSCRLIAGSYARSRSAIPKRTIG